MKASAKKQSEKKPTNPSAQKKHSQPAKKPGKTAGVTKTTAKKPPAKKVAAKKTAKVARLLESSVAFQGPLFRICRDRIIEPSGKEASRDVIRHNGSVVILAVDYGAGKSADQGAGKRKDRKDPWIVIERQYRHAAGQYLWELPAGKLDAGEDPLHGAQRELAEETGYAAHHWSKLVYYYPSPGFLGEGMYIFLAEGLIPGDAHPEDDEQIDFRLVRLSELLERIEKGSIIDGKTLLGALLFARKLGFKSRKKSRADKA